MKKMCILALVFFWVAFAACPGFCEETRGAAAGKGDPKAPGSGKAPRAKAAKARGRQAFTGTVTGIDPSSKIVTITGRGKTVTFDASNPSVRGRGLDDIKAGDYVAVSYTAQGIRIMKTSRRGDDFEDPGRRTPGKMSARGRTRPREKGTSFYDVDENKDGKITPVELSAVISDLTMTQFRGYDRDGDGCLSRSEYRLVKRYR